MKIKIQDGYDRNAIIGGLARAGYKVWQTQESTWPKSGKPLDVNYYVHFEERNEE